MLLVAVALAAASCGGGRSTPRETFESMRAALNTKDGAALDALTDAESVSHRRAEVRERRAMLERGDDPESALREMPLTAEEIRAGTEADASAILLVKRSPLFADARWFNAATVIAETADGPDAACLTVRGVDGVERSVWFVRQGGRWCYDQFRTRRQW
jgi:hypothetical protein